MARQQELPRKKIMRDYLYLFARTDYSARKIEEVLSKAYGCSPSTIKSMLPKIREINLPN